MRQSIQHDAVMTRPGTIATVFEAAPALLCRHCGRSIVPTPARWHHGHRASFPEYCDDTYASTAVPEGGPVSKR